MKKIILYGAGQRALAAIQKYGKENIEYICDSFIQEKDLQGIPIISFGELHEIHEGYQIVITPLNPGIRREIQDKLVEVQIPYVVFGENDRQLMSTKTIHIWGTVPEIHYEVDREPFKGYAYRIDSTISMFQKLFEKYAEDFEGKALDFQVYFGDLAIEAKEIVDTYSMPYIFAYSTIYAIKNKVVPIPDYRCFVDEKQYGFAETPTACRLATEKPWEDKRLYWRGNIGTAESREWLKCLEERYPEKLCIEDSGGSQGKQYIPMTEQARYKYLLDIRGVGWTDRVKILLQLGRPLFLVDRPYKEWYFDKLIPMKHYIPVKEDLSDLIEKYEYMETHPEIYDEIRKNAIAFANEHLSPVSVLKYLRDVCLKYGEK